jgi:hypothetical protein
MTTNWSGHLDFLGHGRFIPINYRLVEIPDSRVDNRIFLKNFKWADPIESDFKKKAIKVRNRYQKPKEWACELSDTLRSTFSQAEICKKYNIEMDKFLKDL